MDENNWTRRSRGILLNAAAFVVVIAGLKAASGVVVLVLAALFLAVVVAPSVFFLHRRGVPFVLGLIIAMTAVIGAVGGLAMVVGSAIVELRGRIPIYQDLFLEHYASLRTWLADFGITSGPDSRLGDIEPQQALDLAANVFTGLGAFLTSSLLVLILAVFLLLEASTLPGKFAAAFGHHGIHMERFQQLFHSINIYLVMKTWISLLTGVLAGVLCAVVGIDFPVLWGVLAFILNYIPNIGSILAGLPPTLLALLLLGSGAAVLTVAGYTVINSVVGNIIEPRVMGNGLGLSPFVVLLSLVFWGWVLGPVGMLLSIPLTMAVKIAMESDDETRWIAVLLGPGSTVTESAAEEV